MPDIPGIYHFHRIGVEERPLELLPDGSIRDGVGGAKRHWVLQILDGQQSLSLFDDFDELCRLNLQPDGCWRGRSLNGDDTPVELVPQRLQPFRSLELCDGLPFEPHRFHYISYAQFVRDCTDLARSLPPVKAVAGVPRSGLIPASIIALELNVPMLAIEALVDTDDPLIPLPRRGSGRRVHDGMILVVDDTSGSGRQVEHLRTLIRVPVRYAAVYVQDRPVLHVDYYHAKLPSCAQCYEWTMFHDSNNQFLGTDLDGVLCDDWPGGSEDEQAAAYLHFLSDARPKRIPSYPLGLIVTNRLERHRAETEAWLARHGIPYRALVMSPHQTFTDRDQAQDAAARKAAAYAAAPALWLFIESDDHQAQEIHRRTGRPVFSMARNGLV